MYCSDDCGGGSSLSIPPLQRVPGGGECSCSLRRDKTGTSPFITSITTSGRITIPQEQIQCQFLHNGTLARRHAYGGEWQSIPSRSVKTPPRSGTTIGNRDPISEEKGKKHSCSLLKLKEGCWWKYIKMYVVPSPLPPIDPHQIFLDGRT